NENAAAIMLASSTTASSTRNCRRRPSVSIPIPPRVCPGGLAGSRHARPRLLGPARVQHQIVSLAPAPDERCGEERRRPHHRVARPAGGGPETTHHGGAL